MNVVIDRLKNTSVSNKQLIELIHFSYEERIKKGLCFTCSTMTEAEFIKKTKDSTVLVAMDKDVNNLVGTVTVSIRKDKRNKTYGYHEYLAVSPIAKRNGVGSKLLEKVMAIVLDANGEYIESDTAVGAESSVAWHLKNGFKIAGLQSFQATNYYSYIFRKQLAPSWKWNNDIYLKMRYVCSSFRTKLLKKEDGRYTIIGVVLKKMMK